jgi:hypothetical protein
MPSRFAPRLYGCNGANDASAEERVNSLLSSYEAFPGGSNLQRKECEAAIDYDTPFSYYLWWSGHARKARFCINSALSRTQAATQSTVPHSRDVPDFLT